MKHIVILLLLVFALSACAIQSTNVIGVVDFGYILAESKGAAAAEAESQAYQTEQAKRLEPKRAELIAMRDDYKARENRLTARQKSDYETQFQAKVAAFQNETNAVNADVQNKNNKLSTKIMNEIKDTLGEVAKEQNINVVVDKNTLLFSGNAIDLTEAVLIRYNLRYVK